MVCLDESSQTVVKSSHGEENEEAIAIERKIYERISGHGGHLGLLHYYDPYELGIRLELAHNDLRPFLQTPTRNIDIEKRLRWARQITDTLRFVHSKNVIHRDLTCGNILLDAHLKTDFAGSSLDVCPLRRSVSKVINHASGSTLEI
jgi:serine/threonine protein kinase